VEHTIGLSAQVDWKEKVTMMDQNGVPHTFSIFLYVLPYSKFKFLKLTLDQKQDTLFRCLFEAFQAMVIIIKTTKQKRELFMMAGVPILYVLM
jgi:transposase